MYNKNKIKSIVIILALSILLVACGDKGIQKAEVRPQDDLYEAVNGQWMEKVEIPPTTTSVGVTEDIQDKIASTLKSDFDKMLEGKTKPESSDLKEFLKYYKLASDYERRNKDGEKPVLKRLSKIENLKSLDDLNKNYSEMLLDGYVLPTIISVDTDMEKSDTNSLYFGMPGLLKGEKSYYEETSKRGKEILDIYRKSFVEMIKLTGKSESDAKKIAEQAIEFDKLLSTYAKSSEESSNIDNSYNPISTKELLKDSENIDINNILLSTIGVVPEKVIVADLEYYRDLDKIISEENLDLIKSWMYILALEESTPYLSKNLENIASKAAMEVAGISEAEDPEFRAYSLAGEAFYDEIGQYYGKTYFGEEAKKDVETMVDELIKIYGKRIKNADWLTEETRNEAIKKLNSMTIQIGYPDYDNSKDEKLTVDENLSLYENTLNMSRENNKLLFSSYSEPVDRDKWITGAQEVNAFYMPTTNTITFPAGILQAPFYSIDQTPSQNYGGIGAIIGHEISHAFDPEGSKYDEKGNLNNWWTPEDYAAFKERTEAAVKQFDGIEYAGGKINGKLTITENVADTGGLIVALEAAKESKDANLEEFFENWAMSWRGKATPETEEIMLLTDTHAPGKLRTNIQVSNLEDFYKTFDVKKGDGMYIAPENRVVVW
ncbi:putative endopeptidase [Anaerosphaera aminiphila DSM 21120]|uniref:Putative endopeptidase n=1 Tax=Anaerosphaera aminiphila DSM 21120 TaxID=1120995 RepID=A0A1M5QCT8_9FIRM|nr:M13 family metallopeptidase [Anaerosphaera aminiphila]SHH11333.1 putative endopeptidase [Anaerosphaera aminiphila DSM 21120]